MYHEGMHSEFMIRRYMSDNPFFWECAV